MMDGAALEQRAFFFGPSAFRENPVRCGNVEGDRRSIGRPIQQGFYSTGWDDVRKHWQHE